MRAEKRLLGSQKSEVRSQKSEVRSQKSAVSVHADVIGVPRDEPDPFERYRFLKRVREFVVNNLDRKITLKDAACVACYEPTYFSERFKMLVGKGFAEWLRCLRLVEARRLMDSTDMTAREVAELVWYGQPRAMRRAMAEHSDDK